MRKANIAILLFSSAFILISWIKSTHNNTLTNKGVVTTTEDSSVYERNILPDIIALNSNDLYIPKKDFKKGTVSSNTLKDYFKKTPYGYSIQLPSSTTIPTPAVYKDILYLSGGFGSKQYYAFNATTGTFKWGVNLDDDGPSSPAIEDGNIVFNTESCTIFCCDMVTGKQKWSYFLGDPLMSMPTVKKGIVFTAYPAIYNGPVTQQKDSLGNVTSIHPTHVLIAIELETGKILWQKWIDSDIMSAPVAKDELLYLTTFSGALYKVNQLTGEFIEAKAMRATSAPIFNQNNEIIISKRDDAPKDSLASETVVYGYRAASHLSTKKIQRKTAVYLDKKVQAKSRIKSTSNTLDAGNGFSAGAPASANAEVAFFNIGQSNVSSLQGFQGSRSIYNNGKIYNTMGDEVVCTDSTGKEIWKHKIEGDINGEGGFIGTPPIYTNGFIIIATLKGDVIIFNSTEGKIINTYHLNDPIRYQPIAQDGWIYVTSQTGKLHAINTGNALITGWNMWGANAARTNSIQ
jgi:Ca-activated chloride channel homolog